MRKPRAMTSSMAIGSAFRNSSKSAGGITLTSLRISGMRTPRKGRSQGMPRLQNSRYSSSAREMRLVRKEEYMLVKVVLYSFDVFFFYVFARAGEGREFGENSFGVFCHRGGVGSVFVDVFEVAIITENVVAGFEVFNFPFTACDG